MWEHCVFFWAGICSNENCPYRHVNVNSNASICEGFLRGYCADGNEVFFVFSLLLPNESLPTVWYTSQRIEIRLR